MKNLIFLNGKIPFHVYHKLYKNEKNFIIAADGGANLLLQNSIQPDIIIGDLDSIEKKVLNIFRKLGTEILKIKEQETTDFEKALNYCLTNNIKRVIVFGAVSERPDHTLNNYSILKRYYKKIDVILYSDEFQFCFIKDSVKFRYKKGNTVSLVPFPKALSVTTNGLKYGLKNEDLESGKREGSLNVSDSETVKVSFKKGNLLLFKKHFIQYPKI